MNVLKIPEISRRSFGYICVVPDSTHEINPVTTKEITDAVKSLNRGKAPDVYGVSAEHICYGGQQILDIIKTLMNDILFCKEIPVNLKMGVLNPIFKNKSNCKESHIYRGITITTVLTRILEATLRARIKPILQTEAVFKEELLKTHLR